MLIFTCPNCHSNILESHEIATVIQEVKVEEESSEFEYGDIKAEFDNSNTPRFQCGSCNYILVDEDGNQLESFEEVKEWLQAHQSQCD